MLLRIFVAILLPFAGIGVVFLVYLCLIWFTVSRALPLPVKVRTSKGLTAAELEKLPVSEGTKLEEAECAVCLDAIEQGQTTRLLPSCNHAFHVSCVDAWLAQKAICPVCRTSLAPAPPEVLSYLHQPMTYLDHRSAFIILFPAVSANTRTVDPIRMTNFQ